MQDNAPQANVELSAPSSDWPGQLPVSASFSQGGTKHATSVNAPLPRPQSLEGNSPCLAKSSPYAGSTYGSCTLTEVACSVPSASGRSGPRELGGPEGHLLSGHSPPGGRERRLPPPLPFPSPCHALSAPLGLSRTPALSLSLSSSLSLSLPVFPFPLSLFPSPL